MSTLPAAELFWSKVERGGPGDCWPWTSYRMPRGYGQVRRRTRTWLTHRVAAMLSGRELRDDQVVMHTCDNPPCCNPAHLVIGTQADNLRDMAAKGRASFDNGHMFRGERGPGAKLTDAQAQEIREIYARGGIRQRDLAVQFGVSQGTVWACIHGHRKVLSHGRLSFVF